MSERGPALSVLLVTDTFETIAGVLRAYGAGVDRSRLEVVVAAINRHGLDDRIRAEDFQHVRVVDAGDGTLSAGEARAFRAASAPLVVFAQHHAFPRPGFAARILEAAATGRWTVIGAGVTNANPSTAWSRAAMWINYGRWRAPAHGVMSDVPGHNSAYRRDALLALGGDLEGLLEAGWPLQVALEARGGSLFLESAASVEMTNPDRAASFFTTLWRVGRGTASRRSVSWSGARRLVYGVNAPLIWLLRLARTLGRARADQGDASLFVMTAVVLGLAVNAAGEGVGYLAGGGTTPVFSTRPAGTDAS